MQQQPGCTSMCWLDDSSIQKGASGECSRSGRQAKQNKGTSQYLPAPQHPPTCTTPGGRPHSDSLRRSPRLGRTQRSTATAAAAAAGGPEGDWSLEC
jgi:hypothetical protein